MKLTLTILLFMVLTGCASHQPRPGVDVVDAKTVTTRTGLQYLDKKIGTGAAPIPGRRVAVHYSGTLTDGRKFDSSLDRGEPFEFVVGAGMVISGWEEGILGMKEGGVRRLVIPPYLGYGTMGVDNKIPPNATLIFDIELLEVDQPSLLKTLVGE